MGDLEIEVRKKRGSFGRDVVTLALGTSFAQVINVLIAPILTRLFSPDDFGLAALFASLTVIWTVISCLRYEMSIMLPQSDEEASNLLALSILAAFVVSILTIPLIWFGKTYILQLLKSPELGPYLWLLPPAVLLGGIFLALNYWNSRTRHFGRLSAAKISNSAITSAAQLGAGFAGYNTAGILIGSTLLGSLASTFMLSLQVIREDFHLFRKSIHWKEITAGLKRHRKFPLYDTGASFLNNVSWQLPTFLLATFFSSTEVGYYALGTRLLRVPMNLIGGSIAQVFFQRASEASNDGSLPQVVENVFKTLVDLGLFPMLILTIVGRDLFVGVFGQEWAEAGVYTQILSIWMFIWFISSPLSSLFRVLEEQEFSLKLNILIFVTRFITLGIGGLLGSTRLALLLFSISGILVYGYMCLVIVYRAGVSWRKIGKILISSFILFTPVAIMLLVIKLYQIQSLIIVGVSAIVLIIYYLYLFQRDPNFRALLSRP